MSHGYLPSDGPKDRNGEPSPFAPVPLPCRRISNSHLLALGALACLLGTAWFSVAFVEHYLANGIALPGAKYVTIDRRIAVEPRYSGFLAAGAVLTFIPSTYMFIA